MTYAETAASIIAPTHPYWIVVDDTVLLCPCDHRVEYDGECPNGHVSPLLELGLI